MAKRGKTGDMRGVPYGTHQERKYWMRQRRGERERYAIEDQLAEVTTPEACDTPTDEYRRALLTDIEAGNLAEGRRADEAEELLHELS